MSEHERIARAAVALCADLLRNYTPDPNHPSYARPSVSAIALDRWEELGRRVLAWQNQLDQPPSPGPRVWKKGDPEPPADVTLLRNIGEMSVGLPYLRRGDGGWRWVGSPTERSDGPYWPWRRIRDGVVLTEVIQDGSNPDGEADG